MKLGPLPCASLCLAVLVALPHLVQAAEAVSREPDGQAVPALLHQIPADVPFFLFSVGHAGEGTPEATTPPALWEMAALQPALAPLWHYLRGLNTLARLQTGISPDLLWRVSRGQWEVAGLGLGPAGAHRFVLRIDISNAGDAIRDSLPLLKQYLEAQSHAVEALPDPLPGPGGQTTIGAHRLSWHLTQEALYVGWGPDALVTFADRRPPAGQALADSDAFRRLLAPIPPRPGCLIAYIASPAREPPREEPQPPVRFRVLVERLLPRRAALCLTPPGRGDDDMLVLELPQPKHLLKTLVGPEALSPLPRTLQPKGVETVMRLCAPTEALWEEAWDALGTVALAWEKGPATTTRWRKTVARCSESLGFSPGEILATLGPGLCLVETRAGLVLLLEIRHPEAWRRYLAQLDGPAQLPGWRTVQLAGQRVHCWSRTDTAWPLCISLTELDEGWLAVAAFPHLLQSFLLARQASPPPEPVATPGAPFGSFLASLELTRPWAVVYPQALAWMHMLPPATDRLLAPAHLPAAEALLPANSTAEVVGRRRDNLVILRSRTPLGFLGILAAVSAPWVESVNTPAGLALILSNLRSRKQPGQDRPRPAATVTTPRLPTAQKEP